MGVETEKWHVQVHVPGHVTGWTLEELSDSHIVHTAWQANSSSITALPPYTLDTADLTPSDNDDLFHKDPTALLRAAPTAADIADGVTGSITIVVNTSATPDPVPMGPRNTAAEVKPELSADCLPTTTSPDRYVADHCLVNMIYFLAGMFW